MPPGAVVVFSAHGIAPEVRLDAERRGLRAIDATCPLVTKVHNEARRFAAKDYDILLVGHEGHEEVVGTSARLRTGSAWSTARRTRRTSRSATRRRVVWLSQTTLSVDETSRDGQRAARAVPRRCSTRRATTSAMPPRTGRPRSR